MTAGNVNSASHQANKALLEQIKMMTVENVNSASHQNHEAMLERLKAEIDEREKAGANVNVNSAPRPDYKTLRDRLKAEMEEKEKAGANDRDRVEISAEGRAKAAQPSAAAPDEGDKKPESEDDKDDKNDKDGKNDKKKKPAGKAAADDSQWQAEIAQIRQKRTQLLQQISGAGGDEDARRKVEAQLAMVEAELASKDTDAYRKSRTTVRDLGSQGMDAAE